MLTCFLAAVSEDFIFCYSNMHFIVVIIISGTGSGGDWLIGHSPSSVRMLDEAQMRPGHW